MAARVRDAAMHTSTTGRHVTDLLDGYDAVLIDGPDHPRALYPGTASAATATTRSGSARSSGPTPTAASPGTPATSSRQTYSPQSADPNQPIADPRHDADRQPLVADIDTDRPRCARHAGDSIGLNVHCRPIARHWTILRSRSADFPRGLRSANPRTA